MDNILQSLCHIDVERSEAWNPSDRDMIFDAVRRSGSQHGADGFYEVNKSVSALLRQWILTTARSSVSAIVEGQECLEEIENLEKMVQVRCILINILKYYKYILK